MDLTNKTVLIIGGATGMGFATAQLVEKLGGNTIIAGHNEEKNNKALEQLSDAADAFYVDVVDPKSIQKLFKNVKGVDHLFVTAAPGGTGDFVEAPLEIKETYIYGKFWSLFMITKEAVKKISKKGSITFITGGFTKNPIKGTVLVSAAFHAVEGFAKALTVEMAPIRFNVIRPGFIDSGFWDFKEEKEREKLFEENKKQIAVNRIGRSEDIAQMATTIMMNSFINGQVIEVNGGKLPT
ncbi:SDR family oxidoreductase [Aquimarina celericrescens]|uniref:SDR family oxidoreductase n=1 Tax=Aquimarina celericrescens TaxID=1964542 RepID=A0ABW5AW20_9FLAO|nr:SDR family oxidoreductase [Aquimarina celericrescens]